MHCCFFISQSLSTSHRHQSLPQVNVSQLQRKCLLQVLAHLVSYTIEVHYTTQCFQTAGKFDLFAAANNSFYWGSASLFCFFLSFCWLLWSSWGQLVVWVVVRPLPCPCQAIALLWVVPWHLSAWVWLSVGFSLPTHLPSLLAHGDQLPEVHTVCLAFLWLKCPSMQSTTCIDRYWYSWCSNLSRLQYKNKTLIYWIAGETAEKNDQFRLQ